ncbi:MAG: hypothetical protein QXI59_03215 [Candidatus Bathyarchaeia archaeon]|nr:hypothetical protein [Candidatus Bathyarchaeota archaeon]
MKQRNYPRKLDQCKDFTDIFALVKRAVKETTGEARSGLMLVLADLPDHVSAFHEVGSNSIVLNNRILNSIIHSSRTFREVKSYIFTVLLHEYLHSLGHMDELEVKELAGQIVKETFGENHPAAKFSTGALPSRRIGRIRDGEPEIPIIIPDLEDTAKSYIQ